MRFIKQNFSLMFVSYSLIFFAFTSTFKNVRRSEKLVLGIGVHDPMNSVLHPMRYKTSSHSECKNKSVLVSMQIKSSCLSNAQNYLM